MNDPALTDAELLDLAESVNHAHWLLNDHVAGDRYGARARCKACESWWPCDKVGLAALAVVFARQRDRLLHEIALALEDYDRRDEPGAIDRLRAARRAAADLAGPVAATALRGKNRPEDDE
jgi:hypothetical protein